MRNLILGGDGYLGWPTAMYLVHRNSEVTGVDSFHCRHWGKEIGEGSLIPPFPCRSECGRGQRWE
jgi:UDP-sulfoquinovose synthase